MRKVVLSMFVTLNGFISGPNAELEWMPGTAGQLDEERTGTHDMLDEMDSMLLGARTNCSWRTGRPRPSSKKPWPTSSHRQHTPELVR